MSEIPYEFDEEIILLLGDIDLAMEDVLRLLEENFEFEDDDDRRIMILHLRMAYINGYRDCYDEIYDRIVRAVNKRLLPSPKE